MKEGEIDTQIFLKFLVLSFISLIGLC